MMDILSTLESLSKSERRELVEGIFALPCARIPGFLQWIREDGKREVEEELDELAREDIFELYVKMNNGNINIDELL